MLNVFTEGMEYFFQEVNKIIYFSLGALEKGKKNSLKQHVSCLIKFYYYRYECVRRRNLYLFFAVTALLVLSLKNQFGE